MNVFLFPNGRGAREHYERTLRRGISKDEVIDNMSSNQFFDKDRLYVWGLTDSKIKIFNLMQKGDIALFVGDQRCLRARIVKKFDDEELAEYLWSSNDGKIWKHIFIVENVVKVDIDLSKLAELCGYASNYNFPGASIVDQARYSDLKKNNVI